MLKKIILTAFMSSILSVPMGVGAMENEKFKKIPQITKSVDNGQVGKFIKQDLNYDINRIYKQI